jgi:hypothetical protein
MRSPKQHLTLLIICLFAAGIAIFICRHLYLGVPLRPTEIVDSWTIEANLKFNAHGVPIKAGFIVPNTPPSYAILDEYFVTHHYGVTTSKKGLNRETTWSIRRANGLQSLYYRGIYRKTDMEEALLDKPGRLSKPTLTEAQASAVNTIITTVRNSSADIQTFAQETVKLLNHTGGNTKVLMDGVIKLENNKSSPPISNPLAQRVAVAAVLVLSQANIHAMIVQGVHLGLQNDAAFTTYLAVFNDKEWVFINPLTGSIGLPDNFLLWAWQEGNDSLVSLKGGSHPQFHIAVSPTPVSALSVAKIRGTQTDSQLLKFSLLQLPINVQQTYQILLTIPIGAFIILLLRNFVGLITFGTFMPVLIALAFRETHIVWGIFLFVTIVFFGLLVRFYLDHLRLLLVPRLAVILTVVILLMVIISIFCVHLGLENGLSVALFPMVILTMTIERMCIAWDERGAFEAIKSGVGSLIAAIVAYEVMRQSEIEYLFFAFPELLFILIALILLAGQYRGYRLFELMRFKALS